MGDRCTDTKSKILTTSLRLFAAHGYENVSMRSIADDIGVKAASLYNHYSGKEAILDACYDYYIEHRFDSRLTRREYEPILKNGTKGEVMDVLSYGFSTEIFPHIFHAYIIVTTRISNDMRANEIYMDDIEAALSYLAEFFRCGIEIGRLEQFNINTIALILLSVRMFNGRITAFAPDTYTYGENNEETVFCELAEKMIPFKY